MKAFVLDASALLTYFQGEKGKEFVDAVLPHSVISAANLSEVVSKLVDGGSPASKIKVRIQNISKLGLKIYPLEKTHAMDAGLLRTNTRKLGLSLGDRFCLSLGKQLNCPILTTEKSWLKLDDSSYWVLKIR